MTREINTIIIHCSATEYGSAALYRKWHTDLGWDDIGYHYVICNAYPELEMWSNMKPDLASDGTLQIGRDIHKSGAHVKNHNEGSIGICLVGDRCFTARQLETLRTLVRTLVAIYDIKEIKGHNEYDTAQAQGKTCPNINLQWLRSFLQEG